MTPVRRGRAIGHGVRIRYTGVYGVRPTRAWPHYGLIESHVALKDAPEFGVKAGGPCEGHVAFDCPVNRERFPDRPVWTVESWKPLTLAPSLLCTACGHHGFIREGRWVPA